MKHDRSRNQPGLSLANANLDPVDLAVMSSRVDGIVREMENTVLRTARSSVVGLSKDFSCSIVSADDELIASAEGLPVHVFGSGLLTSKMKEFHPDFREGDAYLHNDPYTGNTHAADHSVFVPVFVEGEHLFNAVVKAHQADIGNALPTTYMPTAVDVYAEGALIFPCVKVQENYQDVGDVIRMCRARIRAPEIWYGDFLAMVAAVRVAEQRLGDFARKFGVEKVKTFVNEWLEYSERRARSAIAELPAGRFEATGGFDPFPGAEDGIPVKIVMDIEPDAGRVVVDLRDNPDCIPGGLNLSEASALNAAIVGVLIVLNSRSGAAEVPLNAGAFRCFEVLLRENCVVGIPRHPVSCSMATGGPSGTIMALEGVALAEARDGLGAGQPPYGGPPYIAVVSGNDPTRGSFYITQLFCGTAGGPATAHVDGWLSFVAIAAAGLLYRDSVEVDEQKYPILIKTSRVRPDSEGAGRRRGAPGNICEYGPLKAPLQIFYSLEGVVNPSVGVRGGGASLPPSAYHLEPDGHSVEHPETVGAVTLQPGQLMGSRSAGGGGYGDPHEREPERVLADVREGLLSVHRARNVYGVVISGDPNRFETLSIDGAATDHLRSDAEHSVRQT
jgi:N-methylhydantoinase B